jgi:tetratricopeptide (TPR) repeat protein
MLLFEPPVEGKHRNKTMILDWFDAREAVKVGVFLADQFAPRLEINSTPRAVPSGDASVALQKILELADVQVRNLRLNFYKRAKFANSFKWRLLENGVAQQTADDLTHRLVLHLSAAQASSVAGTRMDPADRPQSTKFLLAQANKYMAAGAYAEAIGCYEDLLELNSRHVIALNNLGSAFYHLGRYEEAEVSFYKAIQIQPDFADAHSNIGNLLLLKGNYSDAESFLRRALKLNPRFTDARVNLGLALTFSNRLRDARSQFEKALKHESRNADALFGMSIVAKTEGNFDDADALLSRVLKVNPDMPKALAARASMRKMTSSDSAWLEHVEKVAASGISRIDESELRFAIGKYYDDIHDYQRAFQNYKIANDLLKPIAKPFDRDAYTRFVDTMIQSFTPQAVDRARTGGSASEKPVLLVGMPRSGTSLTEQIIASHPAAIGAGELEFWSHAVHEHEAAIKTGTLSESTRNKLAQAYLRVLQTKSGEASRIVDKAPVNSDYLGVIHSVFPKARFIYMQRDPRDTCLSCYFQKFVLSLNFTMDLSDLAYYYRQHERLMSHWRAVLPPGTILDVSYEDLVADQEGWTRKILDFLGLEWNPQVLNFHNTKRAVATASFWQVRQKVYGNSVRRWRHYERFIAPLLDLKNLIP